MIVKFFVVFRFFGGYLLRLGRFCSLLSLILFGCLNLCVEGSHFRLLPFAVFGYLLVRNLHHGEGHAPALFFGKADIVMQSLVANVGYESLTVFCNDFENAVRLYRVFPDNTVTRIVSCRNAVK